MTCLIVHGEELELLRQAGGESIFCPKQDMETATRMTPGCDAGPICAAGPDLYTHGAPHRAPVATEEEIRRVAPGSVRNIVIAPSGEHPAGALNDTVRKPA